MEKQKRQNNNIIIIILILISLISILVVGYYKYKNIKENNERIEKQKPFRDAILKRITRNIPVIENNMIGHVMDMDHIIIGREIDQEV